MAARHVALGLIVATLFVTGAKCGSPEELTSLQNALRNGDSAGEELLGKARSVKTLSELSAEDQLLRRRLLAQTDAQILSSAADAMDTTVQSADRTADAASHFTASGAVTVQVRPKFIEDLKEVAKELAKEQACQAVLDLVAPKPEEPGEQQTWTDIVSEVVDRMATRQWNLTADSWNQFVEWQKYVDGVADDTDQLTQALLANPDSIKLFARPPVQRAALAYARYCYETPKIP